MMGTSASKICVTNVKSNDGKYRDVSFGASTVQGWRPYQEDKFLCLPDFEANASLWAVFDGHNGPEVAKFAAKHLPPIILKNKNYIEVNIEVGLEESFLFLDELISRKDSLEELNQLKKFTNKYIPGYNSGCTAVVAVIKNNNLIVANIGDSRCLLSRYGEPFPMSCDQKPNDPIEENRIVNAGGKVVKNRINRRLNVSRSFGDHRYKENPKLSPKDQMIIALPEIKKEVLMSNADRYMVLISDGVWHSISNQDLIEFISIQSKTTDQISNICENLISKILPKNEPIGSAGEDNMTIVIVKFHYSIVDIPINVIPSIIGLNCALKKLIETQTGAKITFDVNVIGNNSEVNNAQNLIQKMIQTDTVGYPTNKQVRIDLMNAGIEMIRREINPLQKERKNIKQELVTMIETNRNNLKDSKI